MRSAGMIFGRNKSRVFLLIAAMLPLLATDPVSAIVFHPDGEPNLATWSDRPPKDVVGSWSSGASCVAISPKDL